MFRIPARSLFTMATLAALMTCGLRAQSDAGPATEPQPAAASAVNISQISQVRIVRLSQVRGNAQLDRGTDLKFEPAFVNLPIVAGARLETLEGLAEVEFEDNSSLRLTPNSLVEFPVLGRAASGMTTTGIKLVQGSVYVSLVDAKSAEGFTLSVGNQTITLAPASHLRIDVAPPSVKLAVFNGSATITDASSSVVVPKKKMASFDMVSTAPPVLAHNDGAYAYDAWDKTEADYHKARAGASAFAGSPFAYGVADLGYYGSFSNLGACGSLWRPYLASAGWQPYGSGVWSWYPGAGYSWVSPYPWGWTPYHTGSWEFCSSSSSWGWRPGGAWNGLVTPAVVTGAGIKTRRLLPPPAPRPGQPTLLGVNVTAMPISRIEAGNTFVFRGDSAGLGVPRGVVSDLGKVSHSVAERGVFASSLSENQASMLTQARPAGAAAAHGSPGSLGASGSHASGTATSISISSSIGAPAPASSGSMAHGSAMPSGGSHH